GRAIRVGRGGEWHAWTDGPEAEPAHVENAAQEETGEDGHAFGGRAGDRAGLRVQLDDDLLVNRNVEAARVAVADEQVFGTKDVRRPLRGEADVDTRHGEEAIVAGIVGDARPDARGDAVVEQIGERELGEVADATAATAEQRR